MKTLFNKDTSNESMRKVAKLFMNSLYGKSVTLYADTDSIHCDLLPEEGERHEERRHN